MKRKKPKDNTWNRLLAKGPDVSRLNIATFGAVSSTSDRPNEPDASSANLSIRVGIVLSRVKFVI